MSSGRPGRISWSLVLGLAWLSRLGVVSASETPARVTKLSLPTYQKLELGNGLTILLMERHELPVVNITVLIRAGSAADPEGQEGLAALTADLLAKGTRTRSARQIAAQLDFIGAELDVDTSHDYTTCSIEVLKKNLSRGVDQMADILLNPTFPEDEVEKLLRQRQDELRSMKDRPRAAAIAYLNTYLLEGHVYGRPIHGHEESLASLSPQEVAAFHARHYLPRNAILSAVGDFDAARLQELLQQRLGDWPDQEITKVEASEPVRFAGRKVLLVDKPDAVESSCLVGNLGIARGDPDRVAVNLVNTVLGGRFTSRLNTRLRTESGLSYGAESFFVRRRLPGLFAMAVRPGTANTERAVDLLLRELELLHQKGISKAELESAKAYVKGQFAFRVETSAQVANLLGQLLYFGLDDLEINGYFAAIDATTVADARRVIAEHFPLKDLVFVLVGRAAQLSGFAGKYAPQVDQISISDPAFWKPK